MFAYCSIDMYALRAIIPRLRAKEHFNAICHTSGANEKCKIEKKIVSLHSVFHKF
jgi:hypothetical protein